MKRHATAFGILALGAGLLLITAAYGDRYVYPIIWPEPPVVTPGENNAAPSDAVLLYDGKNFHAPDLSVTTAVSAADLTNPGAGVGLRKLL